MKPRVGIALILASSLVVTACRAPQARTLPPPSSTSSTEPRPTTTEPDYSRIALEPVPGETTTSAPMTAGSSTLRGSVQGPDGLVPGAIVRAERLVGDAVQRIDVRTGQDGTYTIAGIPGGRFRVRAFLPPTLAMDSAEVFFLEDGDTRELRLMVQTYAGLTVQADTSPAAPTVGDSVNLAVRVAERTVDADGIAREVPRAGVPVQVTSTGWTPVGTRRTTTTDDDDDDDPDDSSDPGGETGVDAGSELTDGNGTAVFRFRCDRVGEVTATAIVGPDGQSFALEPPPCRPRPTTTTTSTTTVDDDDGDDDDDDADGDRDQATTSTTAD